MRRIFHPSLSRIFPDLFFETDMRSVRLLDPKFASALYAVAFGHRRPSFFHVSNLVSHWRAYYWSV